MGACLPVYNMERTMMAPAIVSACSLPLVDVELIIEQKKTQLFPIVLHGIFIQ